MSKCSPYSCPIGEPATPPKRRRDYRPERVDSEVRKRLGLPDLGDDEPGAVTSADPPDDGPPEPFSVEVVPVADEAEGAEVRQLAQTLYRRSSPGNGSLWSALQRTQQFWIDRAAKEIEQRVEVSP